jgi:hypothetical protein
MWSAVVTDELRLFDDAVDAALRQPLQCIMRDYAVAIAKGDGERTRLLDSMISFSVRLGYHAVVAERWKPDDM